MNAIAIALQLFTAFGPRLFEYATRAHNAAPNSSGASKLEAVGRTIQEEITLSSQENFTANISDIVASWGVIWPTLKSLIGDFIALGIKAGIVPHKDNPAPPLPGIPTLVPIVATRETATEDIKPLPPLVNDSIDPSNMS